MTPHAFPKARAPVRLVWLVWLVTCSLLLGLPAKLVAADDLAGLERGGTVRLPPGHYGDVVLGDLRSGHPVHITSADPADPAVFSRLIIRDSRNVTVSDVVVAHPLGAGEDAHPGTAGLQVIGAEGVEIRNVRLTGSVDGNLANDGIGAVIRYSDGVVFAGNTCHDLMRCAVFTGSRNLVVRDNSARFIRSDGLDFAGVENVLIESNDMAAFPIQHGDPRHGGDHKDFIQFWSRNAEPSRNVIIRDNVLIEVGTTTQAIFIRSESGVPHENFVIENNIIYSSSFHGISLGDVRGAVIRDNTVIAEPSTRLVSGLNVGTSSDVQVIDNVVARLQIDDASDVTERGTRFIQWLTPRESGYYGDVFANAFDVRDLTDLRLLPGSLATQAGAVALFERLLPTTLRMETGVAGGSTSLGRTFTALCADCPAGTVFQWDFGDGSTARGERLRHDYAEPGQYLVSLSRDGEPPLRRMVDVITPLMLDLPLDDSLTDRSGGGHTIEWQGTTRHGDGAARFIGAEKSAIIVRPGTVFSGLEAMTLAFDLKLDTLDDARLVWLHQAFGLEYSGRSLVLHVFGDQGHKARLVAEAPRLFPGTWHKVLVIFDGAAGTARLLVDGVEVASQRGLDPRLARVEGRDLTIGGIHGRFLTGAIGNLRLADAVMSQDDIDALSHRLKGDS